MSTTPRKIFILSSLIIIAFSLFLGGERAMAQNSTCVVTEASIRTNIYIPDGDDEDTNNDEEFEEEFMQDSAPPFVYFDIQTSGCFDVNDYWDFELSLTETDIGVDDSVDGAEEGNPGDDSYLDDFPIDVPSPNFTLVYLAGEDECGVLAGLFDCTYELEINDSSTVWNDDNYTGLIYMNANQQPVSADSGLNYECDGVCDEDWQYRGMIPYGELDPQDSSDTVPPQAPQSGSEIDDSYLEPLPGLAGQPADLGGFLQGLFNVMIIIAGILAILMIVFGAVEYLSSDAIYKTENGRIRMWNAVLGLILALGAWVILNTINPRLASELRITIPPVSLGNYNFSEPGVISTEGIPTGTTPNEDAGTASSGSVCKKPINRSPGQCTTCQPIPSQVGFSQNAVNANSTQATPALGAKLLALKNATPGLNWVVTEAYPPSRPHCSQKHYLGTTVDADFVGNPNPSPEQVKAFIDAAKSVGLDADWEVKTAAEFNAMVAYGLVPGKDVFNFGAWISGSHFSVYDK